MKKDLLFIGATHGDETIGVEVLQKLDQSEFDFDSVIGNPPALSKGTREFEADLNRSAPGDLDSSIYEKRRAAELIKKSENYRYTIDLHGSIKNTGIFIIITNPTLENFKLASMFKISRIVLWPSITKEQQGSLSEFFSCGIEIESGEKNNPRIKNKLELILTDFLKNYLEREKIGWRERLKQKKIYLMYEPLKKSECPISIELKEFVEVKIKNKTFTPIFIGSYDYENILAYKLKKINLEQALSLS